MGGGGQGGERRRAVVYCVVPRELAPALHEPLRRHFSDDPSVEVVVERRAAARRSGRDQRRAGDGAVRAVERRTIRNAQGRRVGERRGALLPVAPPPLPRRAQRHADRLVFFERLEPSVSQAEDADTARLVIRMQSGDQDAFTSIYVRYFERVYGYLRVVFRDAHEAENATQQVFMHVFEGLPRYERRSQPFRNWLFTVVRNVAVDELRKRSRIELEETGQLNRQREAASDEPRLSGFDWISDRDLLIFTERLPLVQRQVLVLRYMLDLRMEEIAEILGRTSTDVRSVHYRAMTYLRERLAAVGRRPVRERGCGREIDSRGVVKQAPVLRMRRFALSP